MRLHSLRLEGYRKHADTTIYFSDSTFLIGENNVGKSSILKALEYLLSSRSKIEDNEFLATVLKDGKQETIVREIILTAEFRNLPIEARQWRGFKGRVLSYEPETEQDSGLKFIYRKTFQYKGSVTMDRLQ